MKTVDAHPEYSPAVRRQGPTGKEYPQKIMADDGEPRGAFPFSPLRVSLSFSSLLPSLPSSLMFSRVVIDNSLSDSIVSMACFHVFAQVDVFPCVCPCVCPWFVPHAFAPFVLPFE